MVSVCLPSDALLQHLPSYLGFSYLGHGVSLHGCSRKAQPLLLTLDEGYLLTASVPDLQRGMAPLGPPAALTATTPWAWACSSSPPPLASGAPVPGLGCEVAPPGCCPWPGIQGISSQPSPLAWGAGYLSYFPSSSQLRDKYCCAIFSPDRLLF